MSSYHQFDVAAAAEFAAPYIDGPVGESAEVGDGNLNRVFRVGGRTTSVIVKQALPYLKVAGESWPLTRDRARIERAAWAEHDKLAPGLLPGVIHFDEQLSAIVFEDLRGYVSWRDMLVAGHSVSGVAERVGRYSASVLFGTSHLAQSSLERKKLRSRFSYSELCLVTEDLVFTAPYTQAATNRYDPQAAGLVQVLQRDRTLRTAAAEMLFAFKTRDEALIHGDLHTGSVLVSDDDARVIDLEFAFFGPMGFDIGVLLGNLALSNLAHEATGRPALADAVARDAEQYWTAFADECRRLWKPSEPWYHRFISGVLADAARFAGAEMIRRVVGLAHAKDIDSLPEAARFTAQGAALAGGRALIAGPPCTTIGELWERAVGQESFA